ncbi:glutaconate CoA-transferase, partial [bacterium]|nr:glutaconate CoA-transferase [bacterium]
MGRFENLLETTFKLEEREGPDKTIGLREAVRQHVKPKMKLHLSSSYYYPNAIINEIIRQFFGKKPAFTLITKGINLNTINFLTGELVNKVITTFHGDVYPVPRPNPAITKVYKDNKIKIEDWSLYSFTQRLMAGALGLRFIPTNSIVGSSMAEENQGAFKFIDDPFGGESTGILKALNPDISVLHGWAADPYGNIIILPPYGTLPWGAMASRKGVLVTVERIVSTDFIRKYSHFVILPGHFVRSVSLVPFGAHPQGMSNLGIEEFDSY